MQTQDKRRVQPVFLIQTLQCKQGAKYFSQILQSHKGCLFKSTVMFMFLEVIETGVVIDLQKQLLDRYRINQCRQSVSVIICALAACTQIKHYINHYQNKRGSYSVSQ